MTSSSLNLLPSSPRSNLNDHPAMGVPSLPPGSSMTPSSETNCVTTSFLMRLVTSFADESHRSAHERRIVVLARVLEADASIEAVPRRILEEHPGRVPVAVLEDRALHLLADGG